MKNNPSLLVPFRRQHGFSLVEMIGVLAIIAILAVIIVPKVFSTIASARITSSASSINAIKSAVTEFSGKYGAVPVTGGTSRIDDLLLADGLLESRFVVKVGTQPSTPPIAGATWSRTNGAWTATGGTNQTTQARIVCQTSTTNSPATANGTNFLLDGTNPIPAGSRVIAAVIPGCTIAEARELSLKIDGESLSTTAANATTADTLGKVAYNAGATTTVYVYITHQ